MIVYCSSVPETSWEALKFHGVKRGTTFISINYAPCNAYQGSNSKRGIIMNIADLITAVNAISTATTATAAEITAAADVEVKKQVDRNNDYDGFYKALIDAKYTDEEAKERLATYGITKVGNLKAYRAEQEAELEKSLSAKKNETFNNNLRSTIEIAKVAAAIEAETKPADPIQQMLSMQAMMMQQQMGLKPTYAPTPQQPTGPSWSANLLEKSRLTRERDEKISEIRALKKAGGISALEMAQAIAGVNSEYKGKINNI